MASLALNQMTIQLVLRNPLDRQVTKTSGAALSRLFPAVVREAPAPASATHRASRPQAAAPAPQPEARKPVERFVVEIIQGTKRSETTFGVAEKP